MPGLSKYNETMSPPAAVRGMRLVPVADATWRVIDPVGRAIGHLDAAGTSSGLRYRARRYHAPTRSFRSLGDFWSAAEAVDCLRLSR